MGPVSLVDMCGQEVGGQERRARTSGGGGQEAGQPDGIACSCSLKCVRGCVVGWRGDVVCTTLLIHCQWTCCLAVGV